MGSQAVADGAMSYNDPQTQVDLPYAQSQRTKNR